jgi:hypothetical protein
MSTRHNFSDWLALEEAYVFLEARKPIPPWRTKDPFLGKNPKTSKSDVLMTGDELMTGVNRKELNKVLKKADGSSYDDFDSYLIHFSPAAQSGFITCPCASGGCASECLNTAGSMAALGGKIVSRLKRTWQLAKEAPDVIKRLKREIARKLELAESKNKKLSIRLNGTSDFDWTKYKDENGKTLFELFPTVQFYDYTKVADRVDKLSQTNPNYHLTFSRSEKPENQVQAKKLLKQGHNVAVVFGPGKTGGASEMIFKDKVNPQTVENLKQTGIIPKNYVYSGKKAGQTLLPQIFDDHQVIDGDSHDLRFLEKTGKKNGVVIGLTAKGVSGFENFDINTKQFHPEKSGFVVQPLDPGIIKYPSNYDYIVQAMDYVNKRNKEQHLNRKDFAKSKLLYNKKQAVTHYAVFDDMEPLIKVAKEWGAIQNPPVTFNNRKELENYAQSLADQELKSVSFKTPKKLKNELDAIAKFCAEHPEACDKLYATPLKKGFDTAAGGSAHTDPTGYRKPTYQLKMADQPGNKIHPGLAALSKGKYENL